MAQQLKKKFIGNDQVDSTKIKLLQNQALRGTDSLGNEQELVKLDGSDKVLLKGEEAALKSQVDAEQSAREAADSALDSRVASLEADPVTKTYVDSEVSDLQSQIDNVLSNVDPAALDSLTEVVSAFQSADSDIQAAIAALGTGSTSALNQEISDRIAADASLQSQITQEISDRIADVDAEESRAIGIETSLQIQIDTEVSDREADYVDLSGQISQEITNRTADVDAEESRAMGVESSLQSQITQEISDRIADVNAEESRAMGVESSLQSQITQEISDRTAAVSAEETRALAAEGVLQSNIDVEKGRIDAILLASDADKDSFAEIVSLINSVDTENDAAFASYVLSNDDAVADLQDQITSEVNSRTSDIAAVNQLITQEMGTREDADILLQSHIDSEESARIAADAALQSSLDSFSSTTQAQFEALYGAVKVTTSNGTTLTNTTTHHYEFTGTLGHSLQFHVIENMADGEAFSIVNRSGGTILLKNSSATQFGAVPPGFSGRVVQLQGVLYSSSSSIIQSGALSAGLQKITFLANGVASSDAVNKGQLDVVQTSVTTETSARIAADNALDARVDVLESVVWFKQSFSISNGQTSVTLSHTPEAGSMSAFVDRLAIHEGSGEDYTISGTTMTFLNDLVSPGQSQLGNGDTVYVKYQYKV